MAGSFEFEALCQEFELDEGTVTLITGKGFKSYKSISRLSENLLKKEFAKDLSPGQLVLLQAGVEMLRPPPPAEKDTPHQQQQLQQPQAPQQLQQQQQQQQPAQASAPTSSTNPPPGLPALPVGGQQLTANDLLAMWQQAGDLQPASTTPLPDNISPYDPFGFGMGPYAGTKCRQIGEYITHMYAVDPELEQDSTVNIGGLEFSLAKGKKVPQEKI